MATRPPPASTPIHPRLLDLAAQAVDSPSSTPGSVVTASSVDKTGDTDKSFDDDSITNDSSGESLGIRARRPGSSGFVDAGESPQGTSSSESSKSADMKSKSSDEHASSDQSPIHTSHSHCSQPNPAASKVAQSDSLLQADQQPEDSHHHPDRAAEKAGRLETAPRPSHRITDLVSESHFISGLKGRPSNFYSPPPPSQGASLKRGDYYSDSATANIPSPRLEPILEASSEISARYRAAIMAETPLKHAPSMRQTALAGRRQTPYANSLLHEVTDTSKSLSDSSGKLSTPGNKSGASFNDSMFESPLLAPMAPYGSPIRFNTAGNMLAQTIHAQPHSVGKSPVSVPLSKRLTIRRPPALDAPSPLKREEAKIRDMLWKSPAQDEEDAADADILPPEVEQLGPPSPYAVQFDKHLTTLPETQFKSKERETTVNAAYGPEPPALIKMHSRPGPNGNLNKIPTLVGPNSLPYARCPSGVDSFAFDLHNPRPYDAIMPVTKDSTLPKSISCDDRLFYRGSRESSSPEDQDTSSGLTNQAEQPYVAEPPRSVMYPMHRATGATNSTHNERARQRMERVKMATMKREQARMEEQNRKEVARLTRKLAAEQEQRVETMMLDQASLSVQNRELNSRALPFMPRSPQMASSHQMATPSGNRDFPTRGATFHAQAKSHDYAQNHNRAATFSNIAEASHTQNRLLSILQERMQGLQLAPEAQAGLYQAFSSNANAVQPQALPAVRGSGVLSAINTMMHTNQQLISMLQETERMLASKAVSPVPFRYAPPGLEHMVAQNYQPQDLNTYNPASGHTAQQYRFPAVFNNTHSYQQEDVFRPNASASGDPAVLQSQRRKSVTFDESSIHLADLRGNVSTSDIPHDIVQPAPMLSRSVHELPPRPSVNAISQKLLGILPLDTLPIPHPKASEAILASAVSPHLGESVSTLSLSETEARRDNRSSAPSPECFTGARPAHKRQPAPKPLTAAAPQKVSQNKHRSAMVSKVPRQPMSEKSANISVSSINSGKGSQAPRRPSGKENNINGEKTEAVSKGRVNRPAKTSNQKVGRLDDQNWISFVRQMGGVARAPSNPT